MENNNAINYASEKFSNLVIDALNKAFPKDYDMSMLVNQLRSHTEDQNAKASIMDFLVLYARLVDAAYVTSCAAITGLRQLSKNTPELSVGYHEGSVATVGALVGGIRYAIARKYSGVLEMDEAGLPYQHAYKALFGVDSPHTLPKESVGNEPETKTE